MRGIERVIWGLGKTHKALVERIDALQRSQEALIEMIETMG